MPLSQHRSPLFYMMAAVAPEESNIYHDMQMYLNIQFLFALGMPSKKKKYVDRETVPKVGRGGSTIPL